MTLSHKPNQLRIGDTLIQAERGYHMNANQNSYNVCIQQNALSGKPLVKLETTISTNSAEQRILFYDKNGKLDERLEMKFGENFNLLFCQHSTFKNVQEQNYTMHSWSMKQTDHDLFDYSRVILPFGYEYEGRNSVYPVGGSKYEMSLPDEKMHTAHLDRNTAKHIYADQAQAGFVRIANIFKNEIAGFDLKSCSFEGLQGNYDTGKSTIYNVDLIPAALGDFLHQIPNLTTTKSWADAAFKASKELSFALKAKPLSA